jgi:hypothetical protein
MGGSRRVEKKKDYVFIIVFVYQFAGRAK